MTMLFKSNDHMRIMTVNMKEGDIALLDFFSNLDTGTYTSRSEIIRQALREYIMSKMNLEIFNESLNRLKVELSDKQNRELKLSTIKDNSFKLTTTVLGSKDDFFKTKEINPENLDMKFIDLKDKEFYDWSESKNEFL